MDEDLQRHARSFGGVADAYHRGRPSYPDDAVTWLVGHQPATVLEVGAGTGKLTERLVALGHDVHATEPDPAMLAQLTAHLPDVRVSAGAVEAIAVPDRSVDVVVGAQCYHWFDPDLALPEIARVLRPGGHLALVWHERDERIPWVRKLGRIIGTQDQLRDPAASLAASGLFDEVEAETFSHWQTVDRRSIQDLAVSRSNLAVMEPAQREQVLADLLALYDDYGRGMDGMQLPYRTRCFRARVADHVATAPAEPGHEHGHGEPTIPITQGTRHTSLTDSATTLPRVAFAPIDDDAVVLIDFR